MAKNPDSMNSNYYYDDMSSISSDDVMQDYVSSNDSNTPSDTEQPKPTSTPKIPTSLSPVTPDQIEAANEGELFVLDRQTYKKLMQDIQWVQKQVHLLRSVLAEGKEEYVDKAQEAVPNQDTASMFSQTKPLKWIRHVKTRLQEKVSVIKFKSVPEE